MRDGGINSAAGPLVRGCLFVHVSVCPCVWVRGGVRGGCVFLCVCALKKDRCIDRYARVYINLTFSVLRLTSFPRLVKICL